MTDSQSASSRRARLARSTEKAPTKRELRRAQLLAAARKLFLARGFEQSSVSAIVAEAGVAQGTFYLYFKTKHAVLPHLRLEVLHAYLSAWDRAVEGEAEAPADARLVAGLAAVRDAVSAQRDLVRMLRQASSSTEQQEVWLEGRRQMAEPLCALIREGVEDGSFRCDDAWLAAQLSLSLLDDLLYEAMEYERPAPLPQTFAHGARFLLRALRNDEARVTALVPLPA